MEKLENVHFPNNFLISLHMAAQIQNANSATIRGYADIPDIMEIEVPPVGKWIVDGMLPRESVTLWAGADGTAKTYQ